MKIYINCLFQVNKINDIPVIKKNIFKPNLLTNIPKYVCKQATAINHISFSFTALRFCMDSRTGCVESHCPFTLSERQDLWPKRSSGLRALSLASDCAALCDLTRILCL